MKFATSLLASFKRGQIKLKKTQKCFAGKRRGCDSKSVERDPQKLQIARQKLSWQQVGRRHGETFQRRNLGWTASRWTWNCRWGSYCGHIFEVNFFLSFSFFLSFFLVYSFFLSFLCLSFFLVYSFFLSLLSILSFLCILSFFLSLVLSFFSSFLSFHLCFLCFFFISFFSTVTV